MISEYFLGANSTHGFYSLYNEFCKGKNDFLYIIKAGPGGGKSSFMRAIGKKANTLGMDIENIICSADPNSLDGIYIPKIRTGFVDGTSPHVIEPRLLGINSTYVNLSCFCSCSISESDIDEITRLTDSYKNHYKNAYNILSEYGAHLNKCESFETYSSITDEIAESICSKLNTNNSSMVKHRFLSGITCLGYRVLNLANEIYNKKYEICKIAGSDKIASDLLSSIVNKSLEKGHSLIVSHSPLNPNYIDTVIILEAKIVYTTLNITTKFNNTIFLPGNEPKKEGKFLTNIVNELAKAKSDHDIIESLYRPYIDFNSLTAYTNDIIDALFI